jgi:hypothetical protein
LILTRHNVAFYLLERGLLTLEDIVCKKMSVQEQFHRNRNFLVSLEGTKGFFVKQAQEWDHWLHNHSTLLREAACYGLAKDNSRLEQIIPGFQDFSPQHQTLVVDMIEPARSLASFHARTGEFPPELGSRLGSQLATCHVEFGKMFRFLDRDHPFIGEVPWILNPDGLDRFASNSQSGGQAHVINIIRKSPHLYDHLTALANTWHINGIIHGDMKWANCLLKIDEHETEVQDAELKIIDWELADSGHVAWDVGGILQSYLTLWVQSMEIGADGTLEEIADTADYPLEDMQASMQAFWKSYLDQLDPPAVAAPLLRRRSAEYAAARMIQTAFEDRYEIADMSAYIVLMMQLSANIMSDPEAAIEQLFGLEI